MIAQAALGLALPTTALANRATVRPKAKAPVLVTPSVQRLQPPSKSGDFSRPFSSGMVSTVLARWWGWECLSVRTAAWLNPCDYPQPHAMRLVRHRMVSKPRS
jgi:hypothetical protein